MSAAHLLLVNSKFTHDWVSRIYGIQPMVCYYGIDTDVFRPRPEIARQNYVLSAGAIQPHKRFDFLIESLALIPEASRPNLQLVGNTELASERQYLQSLAAVKNVTLQISVVLDIEKLVRYYNQTPLFIYAPHNEALGLVALEAMACGTPVIGVAEGGVKETVANGQTGLLIERDPQKFADAISGLLADEQLRESYGRQAREYVMKEWNWESATAQVEQHLTETALKQVKRANT